VSDNELAYYRAHFREAVQKDGVICLECGFSFKSLAPHVRKHRLSIRNYKEKWGYNRTNPLVAQSTRRKLRRLALAVNLAALSPPDALRKALQAKRGHPSPYRPESRLIQTDAARARVAADLQLAARTRKKVVGKGYTASHLRVRTRHRGVNAGLDRKILSLREKGLWPSEIAPVLGIRVQSVYLRLQALKKAGFTIPSLTIPRPNPLRKVSDEQILTLAQSGLSISEIAAKVGIATNNVWKRIKHLSRRR
jgi:hypothetical protein